MTTESDHENYILLTAKLFESGSITMSEAAKKCRLHYIRIYGFTKKLQCVCYQSSCF